MNTQKQMLLRFLRKNHSITVLQATEQLGIQRLSERIRELELEGIVIDHLARKKVANRFGFPCYVTRYVYKGTEDWSIHKH